MTDVSDKFLEKIKTNILCSVSLFFPENPAVYEIVWKNMIDPDSPQMTIYGACPLQTQTENM